MDTNQLATLFREATDDLEPRAGFTNAVVRGGRRRTRRHRIAVATSAAAALTLVTGGAYAVFGDAAPSQVAAGPAQGDLAGDQEFLASAIQAWEAGKSRSPNASAGVFDDTRGEPYVYWAGDTHAGRVAVVMQQAYLHPHENLPDTAADTLQTLVGLVATDPADGRFKLVTDQFQWAPNDPLPGYFQFGPGDRTVLIVDRGEPLFQTDTFSAIPNPTQEQLAELNPAWEPMPVRDGVAIKQLKREWPAVPAHVVTGDNPHAESAVRFTFVLASQYLGAATAGGTGPLNSWLADGLDWPGEVMRVGSDGGPQVDPVAVFNTQLVTKVGDGSVEGTASGSWHIRAGLADGRVAVLSDNKWGTAPSRIYAVLITPELSTRVIEGDVVNKHSALPVRLRLPDAQGWVIANHGAKLKYRTTTDGGWQSASMSAALVPDETVQVLVGDKVVDLPR